MEYQSLSRNCDTANSTLVVEGILSSDVSDSLAQWTAKTFNHNFDEYDKSIDLIYNSFHIGGSRYHHLLDGQHDIFGAYRAVKDVHVDDGWLIEIQQTCEHLLRDTASISGINPFFSLTEVQFDNLSQFVSGFGVSKRYLADALTINVPELVGGAIALTSSLILAKNSDSSKISKLAGGCLLSSFISANPLLLPIAAGGMVKAISDSCNCRDVFVNAGRGAMISGSVTLLSNLVGGPIWWGCMAGLIGAVAIKENMGRPEKTFHRIKNLFQPVSYVSKAVSEKIDAIVGGLDDPYLILNQSIRNLKKHVGKINSKELYEHQIRIKELQCKAEKSKKNARDYERKALLLLQKIKSGGLDPIQGETLAGKALILRNQLENKANMYIGEANRCEQALKPVQVRLDQIKSAIALFENDWVLHNRLKVAEAVKKFNYHMGRVEQTIKSIEQKKARLGLGGISW